MRILTQHEIERDQEQRRFARKILRLLVLSLATLAAGFALVALTVFSLLKDLL